MSDYYLRLIPTDPTWVPEPMPRARAMKVAAALMPDADVITADTGETVSFIDPGSNFEGVFCPFCASDLGGWWQDALDLAHEHAFSDLSAVTPCCKRPTSLNDLSWKPSAGFSRFVIEARNPSIAGTLSDAALGRIESALGSPLRQVYAHL